MFSIKYTSFVLLFNIFLNTDLITFLKAMNHKINGLIKKKNNKSYISSRTVCGAIYRLITLLRNTPVSNVMTYNFTDYGLYSNHIVPYVVLQMCHTPLYCISYILILLLPTLPSTRVIFLCPSSIISRKSFLTTVSYGSLCLNITLSYNLEQCVIIFTKHHP